MSPTHLRQLAHARAVRARGNAMPLEGTPSAEILDSWVRCMDDGLDSRATLRIPVIAAGELRQRCERTEVVRRLARAELEVLTQQIAGSNFLLSFADPDGVILDLHADNRFSMSGTGAGIVAGSCWAESLIGTNGLGTAIAAGRLVAVTGLEHYSLQLGNISCTAAPMRDAQGHVVGVLNAASYFESRQRHTQALIQMATTHIENGLLLHQMRQQFVFALHPRPEFLGTLSAGLVAFDEAGHLQAMNARGRQLLQGIEAGFGTAFEAVFGEPFEQVLAQFALNPEVRLRDRLGSTLVSMCVSRPQRPQAFAVRNDTRAGLALPRTAAVQADALPDARLESPPAARQAARASSDAQAPRIASAKTAPPLAPMHRDAAVIEAHRLTDAAVRMAVPILILGETGSGKEVLARHAHATSGRRGAFVAVNCGALPAELVEAELFGHVGGAFTGARREGSIGLIASADGGTLLLDEVRELPPRLQATLLRFLDDQVVRPVGGTVGRRVDVQVLAATNAALDDDVAAKRFRADLFYRLNTVCVELPPLRRRSDFADATRAMLAGIDADATLGDDALARLAQHAWPGNFRELRSVLTRALMVAEVGTRTGAQRGITLADIRRVLPSASSAGSSALQLGASDLIRREFERSGGSVTGTARALGISRTTVYRHLREAAGHAT